ncbi:MAG: DNA repair protein RecN [Magnetovibrio sp.]|nr:DNA repair protein RecN [Magnetovibrio sp.]
MLSSLSIRDVVLIDRLDLDFETGLGVLTGETGAGKSILLDALGLAVGMRAVARLVRQGCDKAGVTASFDVADDHPLRRELLDQGVETTGEPLILRRVLGADGRSRAFVNDQAVSVGLLRQIGEALVEIHGQFESQKLLQPQMHRVLLDAFGAHGGLLDAAAETHRSWRDATEARLAAVAAMAADQRDQEFLAHALDELDALAPEPGEEAALAAQRAMMMHGEQLSQAIEEAMQKLAGGDGGQDRTQSAMTTLERVAEKAQGRLDGVTRALDAALNEIADGVDQLQRLAADMTVDPAELERAEDRLFTLRAVARKHGVEVDGLAALRADLADRLAGIEDGAERIAQLERAETARRQAYVDAALALRAARTKAAGRLDARVAEEFGGLKLENARFVTELTELDEADWADHGQDRTAFLVATNPKAEPGPIHKIASGGEMARFMLALKVVLAESDPVPTLIFDEVDAGIGGAVAAAVGERLAALGAGSQVLVVTHSPQVAARGAHHWRVSKSTTANDEADGRIWTTVEPLDPSARQEEVARMLAGAEVTDEARAAADQLLAGAPS